MPDIWVPDSAITFPPEVEQSIADSDDPAEARSIALELHRQGISFATDDNFGSQVGPDSAVILLPREWGTITKDNGTKVLAAFVDSKPLERMILDSTLTVELSAVVTEAEQPMIQAVCPALHAQLREFNVFVPLTYPLLPCPVDWAAEVQARGFAIAIYQRDPSRYNGLSPYFATPPLRRATTADGRPLIVDQQRPARVGRNDRCPCGSGIKFKRCCGA